MTVKIIDDIDISLILSCYNNIESNIIWNEFPNGRQAGLQYIKGNDPWKDAPGRGMVGRPWFDENVELNSYFKDTIFEEIINKYKLTRTRLMWLKPFSCYSMHRDLTTRLHVPIMTNNHCYFVFREHGLFNMPAGHVYHVNTLEEHSAMNCSIEWRLHLLGAVESPL
jgi:hypothetical protein